MMKRFLSAASAVITLAASGALAQTAPPLTSLEREFRNGSPVLQRIAVVIGNSSYRNVVSLRNTINDAKAMAALLRENGFRVLEGYDLDKQATEKLLRDAVMAGGSRSDMVVFFAGHGVQIKTRNYLLPVDAQLTDPHDLPFQTIALDRMLEMLRGQSSRQIAVLDSCRNNPFEGQGVLAGVRGISSQVRRGFAQPSPPKETLLAFSTAPGALALDGDGLNSPYTSALLRAGRVGADSSIDAVLNAVTQIVVETTGGKQRPTYTSALGSPFALRRPPFTPMPAPASVPGTALSAGYIDVPTAAVFSSASYQSDVPGDIVAPRERVIAIGARLLDRLNLDGAQVVLGPPPPNTSYGLASATRSIVELSSAPIPASALGSLVLRLDAVAAKDVSRTTGVVTHELSFDRLDPGGYRTPRALSLSIVPDACDIQAGDWFDPQGVGIHRLNKAVRGASAIAACSRSLRADPSNARFRYQLGRGYEAAGQMAEAERLYLEAANAGYTRALVGYGKRLQARGQLQAAEAAFMRGRAEGDPQATAMLGKLRLNAAVNDAELEAAFDLLTEGVDLGLWSSMEAVSDYLQRKGLDPARASRFTAEAERRRGDVDVATVDQDARPQERDDRGGGNVDSPPADPPRGDRP